MESMPLPFLKADHPVPAPRRKASVALRDMAAAIPALVR